MGRPWPLLLVLALAPLLHAGRYSHGHHRRRQAHLQLVGLSPNDVQISIYPTEITVRDGRDATFDCRARTADNSQYPEVRWTRVGGPLPSSAHESGGRLTLNPVSTSDSGRYVCVATLNGRTVESHAQLTVQSYGPQELQGVLPASGAGVCSQDERSCGAPNECVKKDYVCDGERDCRNGNDESQCQAQRVCEPNEHRCNNGRCVQKMWLCDGDDDCADGSDEQNCGAPVAGQVCQKTEFSCGDQQCVPQSFHCDGTNDCRNGGDEVGCVQPTVVDPPETNKQVPQGSQFRLTCKAVAVPEPYINWRLNWGPVCDPPRCIQTSEGGVGTLTVNNAQPVDQGAYTCEAINVKGRVLATPDCIVRIVNIPAPQPPPPPPPQPQPPPRPQVSCGPGASQPAPEPRTQSCQCKPLVRGPSCNECVPGAFHLTPKAPQGCLKCFCFGVTNQCRSSNLYRAKERLSFSGDAEGVTLSDIEERSIDKDASFDFSKPGFLTYARELPATRYWRLPQRFLGNKVTSYGGTMELEIEYSGDGALSREPLVVLKGNQMILVHKPRNQEQLFSADTPVRVTIETYESNYEQLNGQPATREELLTVLADLDAFLIRASHVQNQYSTSLGDVSWEIAVERATGDGLALEVELCSCPPAYVGTSCEDCAPGYERSGQGPYLGTCVPVQRSSCSPAGAVAQTVGRCQCKAYTTGANCDQCAPHSFHLSPSNPQGCIPCFCSGVTQQCSSSSYTRTTVSINYPRGDRDQLSLVSADARSPISPQTPALLSGRDISFGSFHEARGQTLYWKLPAKFLGNKVTAYGGTLKYVFRHTGNGPVNSDADVILRGNDITLQFKNRQQIQADRENTVEVKITENNWQRSDGQPATREHLMMALSGISDLLVKASYHSDCSSSSLISVSLEFAEPSGSGQRALEVEQCDCPPGYVGTSCEDCAPGYSRTGGGLYLGLCERCECHGHASRCDKEYGFCVDCQHNTEGDQCERCKAGFVGDARRGTPHDCQPEATKPPCQCNNHSPRGCDSFGRCLLCEHSTEGTHCERCKKGYYGDATRGTPYDCTPCPCPGASECFLDPQGQVTCRNCPAGLSGRLCNECAPGYTRNHKSQGRECEPIGRVDEDRVRFIEDPEAGRPPSPVVDPPHLTVNENEPASFRCWVPGIPDCQIQWHKERFGGPLPHGVYQTGNALKIPRAQLQDAGNYICTAANIYGRGESPPARLDVVRPTQRPKIDPTEQTVNEGDPARFRCWVPGNPAAQLEWHRPGGAPLPVGVQQNAGLLHIPNASPVEAGQYVCTATDPREGTPQDSEPATLNVRQSEPQKQAPVVDPPQQLVDEGQPARFRCYVPGEPRARIQWNRQGGAPLARHHTERDGVLEISRSELSDVGYYECTAYDPLDNSPSKAPPARLDVRRPDGPKAPQVDPPEQTVRETEPFSIRCWVPGDPNAVLSWSKRDGPISIDADINNGDLRVSASESSDAGTYECRARDPRSGQPSPPAAAIVHVTRPNELKPLVDPPSQTIPEGEPLSIRCWAPDFPNARLTWRRRDNALSRFAQTRDGTISVARSELSDAGDYICLAEDPETRLTGQSDPARVNVEPARPSSGPVVDPPEQTVDEGDPASIRCWVPGNPRAELSWRRRDGDNLPTGSREDGGTLSIPQTTTDDEGDYICVQSPSRQGDPPRESTPARVNVRRPGQPPRPVATPPLQTVKTGDTARFHCDAHSPTPYRLSWGFGSSDGPLPRNVQTEGDDIIIRDADDDAVGDYVCSATNQFGRGEAEPVKLLVTDNEEPPTARVTPRVWNGRPHDRHQFQCHVTGVPPPQVTWTGPGGSPLPHDVTELAGHILDFADGRAELNGDYTCTAVNIVGEAKDHGSVVIGPALRLITNPPGPRIIVAVGEPVEIKCEAQGAPGDPDPEVEWLHDPGPERGDLPDDFKPVTISEQFIRHPSIGLGNAGVYTCKGSSPHATATKDIFLEVVEASKLATVSILGPSRRFLEPGEQAQLVCTATGTTLVDRLEWVKLNDQLPSDVEEHNTPGVLHFGNFRNSYAGDYECRGYRNNDLIASSQVSVYGSDYKDDDIVKVSINPPDVRVVNQGESIVLKCSVEGAENGENYQWALLRGGSLVSRLGNEATLTIKKADPSNDFGVYRCNVEDDNGVVIGSAYTAVTVGYDGDSHAQIVKFDDKAEAQFVCPVYAIPGSEVEWSRPDGDLPSTAIQKGNKLEITEFDDSASGLYVCKVKVGGEEVEGYVRAQIYVPDTIIQVLLEVSSESVAVGDRAWFDCIVTGDPSATITWTKEGSDELPDNAQVTGNRLLFTSLSEEHTGTYKCRAKTKAGPLETRTVLNVGAAAKRKRKHSGRRASRHSRHSPANKSRQSGPLFGSWFSS